MLKHWKHAYTILQRLLKNARPMWQMAEGPIKALICALRRAGFEPILPSRRLACDELGELQLDFSGVGDLSNVWNFAIDSIYRTLAVNMSKHYSPPGIQHMCDWDSVTAHLKVFRKHERPAEYGRILAFTIGSCWPILRRFESKMPAHSL